MRSTGLRLCEAVHLTPRRKHYTTRLRRAVHHAHEERYNTRLCEALHLTGAERRNTPVLTVHLTTRQKRYTAPVRSVTLRLCEAVHHGGARRYTMAVRSTTQHRCEALHLKPLCEALHFTTVPVRSVTPYTNACGKSSTASVRSVTPLPLHPTYSVDSSPRGGRRRTAGCPGHTSPGAWGTSRGSLTARTEPTARARKELPQVSAAGKKAVGHQIRLLDQQWLQVHLS